MTNKIIVYLSTMLLYFFLFFIYIRAIIWKVIFIYNPSSYYFFEKVLFGLGLVFCILLSHQLFFQKTRPYFIQRFVYLIVYLVYIIGPLFLRPVTDVSYNFHLRDLFLLNQTPGYLPVAIYNISLFFPLGFFSNVSVFKYFILVLLLEFLQYVSDLGAFDIVDILIYSIGYFSARVINLGISDRNIYLIISGVLFPFLFLLYLVSI